MKRKMIAILFVSIMVAGCGNSKDSISLETYNELVAENNNLKSLNEELEAENEELQSQIDSLSEDTNSEEQETNQTEENTVNVPDTETQVILDEDNLYCEFRGITEYSAENWILDLYIENNQDQDVYLTIANHSINGSVIDLANNGIQIPAGTNFLASANFSLIIDTEKLASYNIEKIENLTFDLQFTTGWIGDTILNKSIEIDV